VSAIEVSAAAEKADAAPPPPSGRSRARAPRTGDGVPVKATVPPWVRDAIDEAAIADGISRSGWIARELERIVRAREGR